MTIAVVYQSKYGHSAAIAGDIASELDCPHLALDTEAAKGAIEEHDTLVLVTPFYAGGLLGADTFMKLVADKHNKRVVGVTVGASDPEDPKTLREREAAAERATPADVANRIDWFHARGGINYPALSFVHRQMMRMVLLKAKREAAAGDSSAQEFVKLYGTVVEFDHSEICQQITAHVRAL